MKVPRTPSIKFIAEMSNCSSASVSNVINKKGSVGKETKALILKNIRKFKYKINPSARSLRVRMCEAIAISFSTKINLFKSEFYLNLMQGFHKRVAEEGFDLLLCEQESESEGEIEFPSFVMRGRADAVAIMNSPISEDMQKMLVDYKMPAIMLDSYSPNIDSVISDGFFATSEIVSLLYGMKHRRIAYFAYDNDIRNSEIRIGGFLNGAKNHNILDTCKNYQSFPSEGAAFLEFDRIFAQKNPPTAIIACNDYLACSLMQHAQSLGFSVPSDISFFGYGDILLSKHCSPGLSTVNVDAFQLGQVGADLIIKRIKNPKLPIAKAVLPVKLIQRESVGVCRNG